MTSCKMELLSNSLITSCKMELLSNSLITTGPESEDYSNEGLKDRCDGQLSERREGIAWLRVLEAVRLQGNAVAELRKTQVDKSTAPFGDIAAQDCYANESKSNECLTFELGAGHTSKKDYDDEDDYFPLGGIDRGIHASIEAIRHQASRVDTVMALNLVDTFQQELNTLTRAMNNRTAEMEEMRALIRLKDDRLATLELERDLYRADANEMKSDLEICSERIKSYDDLSEQEFKSSTRAMNNRAAEMEEIRALIRLIAFSQ
jgi:hypothetical protein